MPPKTTLRSALYAYPWALHRPDLNTAIDRVVSSGCDELVVTPCYHRADFFQPADPTMPICYGERGAVFYGIDESLYSDTPIRPRLSRLVDGPDDLEHAAEATRQRGMDLSLWMIYNFQDELSETWAQFARHDPFGNGHRGALSLGAPEVSSYFVAQTHDVLNRFKPNVVWIESLYRQGMAIPSKTRAIITPRCQFLLALDWNQGMRAQAEKAGVPANGLCQDVAAWLRQHLARMPTEADSAPVDEQWLATAFDGALTAYMDVCREVTTSLWEQIHDVIQAAGSRIYHQPVAPGSLGTDLDARVNARIGRVMMSPSHASQLQAARQDHASGTEFFVPFHGQYDDEASLVKDVEAAAEVGADGVSFYAYGLLRDEQLQWIRNAL
jgi:hypothetical protein